MFRSKVKSIFSIVLKDNITHDTSCNYYTLNKKNKTQQQNNKIYIHGNSDKTRKDFNR